MENLVPLLRRIYQKLVDEFLFFLRGFSSPDYQTYRRIRRLVTTGQKRFFKRNSFGSLDPSSKNAEKYFLWNNPLAGFSHQTSVYLMGFVIARLLNRTVILNHMRLNLYHNRNYDRFPRLCDPKIFFNWDKLNEIVKVITTSDFSNLNDIFHFSKEHVPSIDFDRQYHSDLLLTSNNRGARRFFSNGIIPDGIMERCDSLARYIEYSSDIRQRAQAISDLLGDYDAIHIRRGDMLFKGSFLLNNTVTPAEVFVKTDLFKNIDKLKNWIEPGRNLYIATDEKNLTLFSGLKKYYEVFFAKDFKEILANDKLPPEARNNSYYILCIEELILCNARRFVGALPVSATRKVDKMRMHLSGIDKNIYNLASNKYLEYAKNRDVWCVSFKELCERIQKSMSS